MNLHANATNSTAKPKNKITIQLQMGQILLQKGTNFTAIKTKSITKVMNSIKKKTCRG